ncbi:MAG TPA: hypothetical protein VNQ31_10420 [Sphingomonadaceae bacterium]|nr:hypothetical protein [Sphingomonadaceae bacterium]
MRGALPLLVLLGAGAAVAGPALASPRLPACPPPRPQLFLSPMGEPFRAPADAPYPLAAWFAQADANHDGAITPDEMAADADRFFALLDVDGDGELLPDEIARYERKIAPEVQIYTRRADPFGTGARAEKHDKRRSNKPAEYGGAMGAGRYAFLNIPEPVEAADSDFNRAVDRVEFRAAAVARFRQLDRAGTGRLTLAALPKTPAQTAATACDPTRPPNDRKEKRR